MGHLDFAERKDKVGTPDRWLPVAAQIAEHARMLSGRGDIVANIGPSVGGPYGTACWNPILCDLDVNSDTCLPGIWPDRVNLKDEVFVLGALPFMGAISHESAHARWSTWVPQTLIDRETEGFEAWDKAHIDIAIALEESRVEYRALLTWGRGDLHLRDALTQMALSVVLRDFKVSDSPYGASISAALTLARYDAGLFTDTEADTFRTAISKVLDDDTLATLRSLWTRFHNLAHRAESDSDFRAMWQITDEWLTAVREATPDNEDGTPGESGIPEDGGSGGAFAPEGSGSESTGEAGGEGDLAEAMREAAGEAAMDREGHAMDKRAAVVARRVVEAKVADAERRKAGKKMISKRHDGDGHAYSDFVGSHKRPDREPSPDERAASNRLGAMLEKITWRDRVVRKVQRIVPGGRLRPRAAVQQAAEKAHGGREQIPMWRAKERVHSDETPITVGIMTDISGSMGSAEDMSAVVTYVMANAVHRIDGKVATAMFGSRGFLVMRAHQRPEKVEPWGAYDGTEAFREAALLTDTELNLLDGPGARVLMIFTDACFVSDTDYKYAITFMNLCKQKGVAVLWVNTGEYPSQNYGYGALVQIPYGESAAKVAERLGKAVLAEVQKVNAA